jgi:predicted PurR-regulated permease PerM
LCVSLALFVILLLPTVMLADTLVNTVQLLAKKLQAGTLEVPPPPAGLAAWPLIGEPLHTFWRAASENLGVALKPVAPQLQALGAWLVGSAARAGLGILQFLAAIIIAGVLLAYTQLGARTARTLGTRLAGEQGTDYINLAEATVRSVARGILGVALIQSLLAGLGFLFVGIPGAGLWAFIALFLSVIQVGVVPVTLPAVIYVFATADTGVAVIFLCWNIFISAIDNLLKPMLLGRGVKVPMFVIFVGSIGGFIALGIIGLFTGAVVLALGYKLFMAWLDESDAPGRSQDDGDRGPTV